MNLTFHSLNKRICDTDSPVLIQRKDDTFIVAVRCVGQPPKPKFTSYETGEPIHDAVKWAALGDGK